MFLLFTIQEQYSKIYGLLESYACVEAPKEAPMQPPPSLSEAPAAVAEVPGVEEAVPVVPPSPLLGL